ncbi:MAG: hypothetical protein L3J08_01175 [Flavobacteriaceae bacterium]|nr:hypothetical protein [Flavobacteriaceae bacterium]
MKNKVYYIAGSDGSGKTTLLKDLEKELLSNSNKTNHIWIRSPKILSKPLMLYCRLLGLTKYKTINGVKYGKHEFYRSRFVSWLFPILQLIDFKIKWFFEKRKIKPNEIILFDRFNLDTLCDLMVDTKRMNLHKSWVGKSFMKLSPKNCKLIILKVDADVVRSRKLDTLHDEQLDEKIKIFQFLSKELKIKLIENNLEYSVVKDKVINYMLNGKV